MIEISIIGFLAGIFTTTASLPQFIKVIKTKSTHDLSLWMYIICSIGSSLWLVYGILIKDIPVMIASTVSLILDGWILCLKIIIEKHQQIKQANR